MVERYNQGLQDVEKLSFGEETPKDNVPQS